MFIKNEDYIIREENEFYLAYNYIAHTYYQLLKLRTPRNPNFLIENPK